MQNTGTPKPHSSTSFKQAVVKVWPAFISNAQSPKKGFSPDVETHEYSDDPEYAQQP